MSAIATHGLAKTYASLARAKRPALDRLDLEVGAGECFGFLGRNGAGKTTTIKLLCSLIRPTGGAAFIFGEDVRARATRRLVGYLPEQPYFYEYLTPRETLDFYGRVRGMDRAARARAWEELAGMLDLAGIADERIKGFSKGMRQRVGFAVALLGDPPLLILDEPMSGLDPLGRRNIRELMLRLKAAGKTLFFSSHVLSDVEQVCDRFAMLVNGRLARTGGIGDLARRAVRGVEVVAEGVAPGRIAPIAAAARAHRQAEGRDVLIFPDTAAADAAVRAIHAAGGALVEFSPVRESLEEFFLREQAAHAGGHTVGEIT